MFNSSPPSAAYMCQWIGSSLVQVMACRLFSTKLLPKPMLAYCQLDLREQISVKFQSEFYCFHSRKCISKCLLQKWQPFCSGGDELNSPLDFDGLFVWRVGTIFMKIFPALKYFLFYESFLLPFFTFIVYWQSLHYFVPNNAVYLKWIIYPWAMGQ